MTAEIGHFALALAAAIALVQACLPLIGAQTNNRALMLTAAPAAIAQAAFVTLSFGALTLAYVTSDFSVMNVAQNSHTAKPMLYKVTGVWGNHEGSMLLWILILTLCGAMIAIFGRNLPLTLRARVLSVQSMLALAFLLFSLLTSNPFLRVFPTPLNGQDLNPLLQDPGLAFHPPFLYGGYVGFSMAFSFAIAALIGGKVDAAWARWVRPWTLAAWISLTIGIALGSYWAYYELGWGGWWFWDPVENASFMPWLVGTALLHSAVVVEKRNAMKAWTVLLAILTFSLSLLGTFLVRSGVLTSVHAFAVDPARGVFILAILTLVIGGSLILFAWRAPALKGGGIFAPISREGGLLLNNVILTVAAGAVLIGTLYPLLLEALNAGKISVGAPFFNMTFGPLMIPLLLAVPFGPLLSWKRGDLLGALQRLYVALGLAIVSAIMVLALTTDGPVLASIGVGVALWIVFGSLTAWVERVRLFEGPISRSWSRMKRMPRAVYGSTLAHLGLGLSVLGIVSVSAWKVEDISVMQVGDTRNVSGYEITFKEVAPVTGKNFDAYHGVFDIVRDGRHVAQLNSQRRVYWVTQMPTTEVGLRSTLAGDLYIVLGDPQGDQAENGWAIRIYRNPLVGWIWIGALIMGLGGIVSLTDRRLRIGAPTKARTAVKEVGAAAAPAV